MRYDKRRIYFKTSKTDLCDCLKKMQKEHTYTVDRFINGGGEGGLYPGALKTGIKYSLANGLAYIQGA